MLQWTMKQNEQHQGLYTWYTTFKSQTLYDYHLLKGTKCVWREKLTTCVY